MANVSNKELLKDVQQLLAKGDLSCLDTEEFSEMVEKSEAELQRLLDLCEDPEYVKSMKLEDVVRLPFNSAKNLIMNFSMEKRIQILDELEVTKDHYYDETKHYYDGIFYKDDMMTPKEFRSLMGRIKHLEILQGWLFGID